MVKIFFRMFKKAFQRGRSERGGESYSFWYVEPLSDARTKLEDFFNILLALALSVGRYITGREYDGNGSSQITFLEPLLLITRDIHLALGLSMAG